MRPSKAYGHAHEQRGALPDGGALVYHSWAEMALMWGLKGLLQQDLGAFEARGMEYVQVLWKAENDGMGALVEETLATFKQGLKRKKEQKAFEELEVMVRLLAIKDPFEGWRALGKELSKVWPKGVSAVRAIREQRK